MQVVKAMKGEILQKIIAFTVRLSFLLLKDAFLLSAGSSISAKTSKTAR